VLNFSNGPGEVVQTIGPERDLAGGQFYFTFAIFKTNVRTGTDTCQFIRNPGCPRESYPYAAVNPENGTRRTIKALVDLEAGLREIMATSRENYTAGQQLYFLAPHVACINNLYLPGHTKLLRRYIYSRDLGMPAFAGPYDAQPAWWHDALAVIQTELAAVWNCRCQKCGSRGAR